MKGIECGGSIILLVASTVGLLTISAATGGLAIAAAVVGFRCHPG